MCQCRFISYNYLSGGEILIVEEVVHVLGQQLYRNLIFIQFCCEPKISQWSVCPSLITFIPQQTLVIFTISVRYLVWFQVLTIMNKTSINKHVKIFVWISVPNFFDWISAEPFASLCIYKITWFWLGLHWIFGSSWKELTWQSWVFPPMNMEYLSI